VRKGMSHTPWHVACRGARSWCGTASGRALRTGRFRSGQHLIHRVAHSRRSTPGIEQPRDKGVITGERHDRSLRFHLQQVVRGDGLGRVSHGVTAPRRARRSPAARSRGLQLGVRDGELRLAHGAVAVAHDVQVGASADPPHERTRPARFDGVQLREQLAGSRVVSSRTIWFRYAPCGTGRAAPSPRP